MCITEIIKLIYNFVYTDDYKRYAYSIVSEYLPVDVQKLLLKHLGLPENVENNKRKANVNNTDVNKKVKHSSVEDDVNLYKVEKVSYLML